MATRPVAQPLPHPEEQMGTRGDLRPIPDPTLLTLQMMQREVASLKEIVYTRLDGMDRAIVIFNDAITRTPTDTDKQISHLKALHNEKFEAVAQRFAERDVRTVQSTQELTQMITALTDQSKESLGRMSDMVRDRPAAIEAQVRHLQDLQEEKFRSIETQFAERDTRTEQTSRDSKVAVDAALQAAKEAVEKQNTASALAIAKAETGTAKQIDQLTELFQTAIRALEGQFSDLKERVLLIEGRTAGLNSAQATHHTTRSASTAANNYVVALIGLVVGTLIALGGILVAVMKP